MKSLLATLLLLTGVLGGQAHAEYRLGADDMVRVTVFEQPDLGTVARLGADGTLNFPLVGALRLGGLTEREAEARIATALAAGGYVREPQVTLLVEQYRSQEIALLGRVNRPGKYPLTSETTLVDAIAVAGGIGPGGSERVVLIQRADGQETRRTVDLRTLLTAGSLGAAPKLAAGDVIYVPPVEQIFVYGQVQRPGAFALEPGMTVMQALALAGSISQRGTESGLQVRRPTPDGGVERLRVKPADTLAPNDTLYVRESWF